MEPRKPVYKVFVRAGKDRDALRAAVEKFYKGWGVHVESLGGTRNPDIIFEKLLEEAKQHKGFTLYLAGREDESVVRLIENSGSVTLAAASVAKKRVRNARLEEIAWGVEKARARLRLRLAYKSGKLVVHEALMPRLEMLVDDQPYADVFLATHGWIRWLTKLGAELDGYENIVVERLSGGQHLVFLGNRAAYELHIPDAGVPRLVRLQEGGDNLSIDTASLENVASTYESISTSLLIDALEAAEELLGRLDSIVVPWSGGKDSTIALMLAKKTFKDVIAVYVDTGVDFPQTREYVEEYAEKLGVELYYARAPVRENIRIHGMPRHDYRWCTGLKLETLQRTLSTLGDKLLVITGDRDAESESRSRRPPIRYERVETVKTIETIVVSPLKQWSTLLLQLYAKLRGVKLNPLYDLGFYRLGCYICPALRSWEKMLLRREPRVAYTLVGLPFYTRMVRLSQG